MLIIKIRLKDLINKIIVIKFLIEKIRIIKLSIVFLSKIQCLVLWKHLKISASQSRMFEIIRQVFIGFSCK